MTTIVEEAISIKFGFGSESNAACGTGSDAAGRAECRRNEIGLPYVTQLL